MDTSLVVPFNYITSNICPTSHAANLYAPQQKVANPENRMCMRDQAYSDRFKTDM